MKSTSCIKRICRLIHLFVTFVEIFTIAALKVFSSFTKFREAPPPPPDKATSASCVYEADLISAPPAPVFFNLFAAAAPSANLCVAHGTWCNDPSVYPAFCNKPDGQKRRIYVLFQCFYGTSGFFGWPTPGVGNLFTITGRTNCVLSLAGRKIYWFYPKVLPLSNYEEEWLLLTY